MIPLTYNYKYEMIRAYLGVFFQTAFFLWSEYTYGFIQLGFRVFYKFLWGLVV